MKLFNALTCVSVLSFANVGGALAGPQVQVTFKNNSDQGAVYAVIGRDPSSYADANPKPEEEVGGRETNIFYVRGRQSPSVTTASFKYDIGMKSCLFRTSYVKLPGRGGTSPKWNKSAVASGGARCEVKVTSVNMSNHDWAVEFSMR